MSKSPFLKKSGSVFLVFIVLLSVFALGSTDISAREIQHPLKLQFMVGEMVIENDDRQISGDDYEITLVGAAVQKPLAGKMTQAGIETGLLFNWKSETRASAASIGGDGGTAAVEVDVDQFLVDYFFGGYVSIQPINWFRLYVGAGSLLIYGSRETEEKDPVTLQNETDSDSGFSAGIYGRAGIDIVFTERFTLGAGVRGTMTGLSLDDAAGEMDVEGWQYFGVLSFRF
mgnify:CR=1 FL=1